MRNGVALMVEIFCHVIFSFLFYNFLRYLWLVFIGALSFSESKKPGIVGIFCPNWLWFILQLPFLAVGMGLTIREAN